MQAQPAVHDRAQHLSISPRRLVRCAQRLSLPYGQDIGTWDDASAADLPRPEGTITISWR
jgi:hypothetical protein